MSTIAARLFSDAFDDARAELNDQAAQDYTNAVLLPHGASIHAEIQDAFAAVGVPLAETTTTALTYAANSETIVVPVGVTDLQAPLEIWEKGADDSLWIQMERVTDLRPPFESPASVLGCWEWRNGTIVVLPCSETRDIFCRYRRQLAYPTAATAMGFDGFYFPLVLGTAARAALRTGRTDISTVLGPLFYKRLADVVQIASRDRQGISFRQQGWSGYTPRAFIISQD